MNIFNNTEYMPCRYLMFLSIVLSNLTTISTTNHFNHYSSIISSLAIKQLSLSKCFIRAKGFNHNMTVHEETFKIRTNSLEIARFDMKIEKSDRNYKRKFIYVVN